MTRICIRLAAPFNFEFSFLITRKHKQTSTTEESTKLKKSKHFFFVVEENARKKTKFELETREKESSEQT